MGLTVWRWCAGVAGGCVAVAAALLPFPSGVEQSWAGATPAPLAAELGQLSGEIRLAHAALRTYRSTAGLERWKAASASNDTTAIRIDRTLPPAIANAARAIALDQWKTLGSASAAHSEIFIYLDTTAIPRASVAEGSRRSIEGRGMVDIAVALPEVTDDTRCVSLVRLRGLSAAHVDALRNQSLTGVCGFFAAFGKPGAHVARWLAETDYRFARRTDWHIPRAPAIDATSKYALSEHGGRCLTGSRASCLNALFIATDSTASMASTRAPAFVIEGVSSDAGTAAATSTRSLGDAESGFLADAVRAIGPERFTLFWTARETPNAAFATAAGVGLDEWTQRWTTRTYGAVSTRPVVRALDVVWLAVAMPVLVVIAVRPRERLLAQSARKSRDG